MKKTLLLSIILTLFVLVRCAKEDDSPATQKKNTVTFSIVPNALDNGRKQSSAITGVTGVVVTITTPTGEEVLSHHKININQFGDGFVTEPVELAVGHYLLTDFFLEDASSNVVYATPHKGSKLGVLPKQPLDREFTVAMNTVNAMNLEVVETAGFSPEDFGYKSFSVTALKFFSVAAKIEKQGKSVFTTAQAFLLHGTDTLVKCKIGTAPTFVKFNAIDNAEYDLVVLKDGFARYSKHFTFSDLQAELNRKPLTVNLTPALTIRLNYQYMDPEWAEHGFKADLLTVSTGNIDINWGDGSIENFPFDPNNEYVFLEHDYPLDSVSYFISITGDLNKVIGYTQNYSEYLVSPLNLDALPELNFVNLFLSGIPGVLDVRQNTKLTGFALNASGILLPQSDYLSDMRIFSDAKSSLDYIINNAHKNAVAHSTYDGRIDFNAGAYDYSEDDPSSASPITRPSDLSITKLKVLRDKYHWKVYPPIEGL